MSLGAQQSNLTLASRDCFPKITRNDRLFAPLVKAVTHARFPHDLRTFELYSKIKDARSNPMNEEPVIYHAYLLRLWRAQVQGQWQWRASLESPHTCERQSFTNLEQLFAFLRERCSSREANMPELGKELINEKTRDE
jgi:hypothetical protein